MTPKLITRNEAALQLMENVLREGRSLAPEYPLVFNDDATGHIEAIEEGGEVAATCAWIGRTLLAGEADVPIALVGSVAAAAEHRGKGLGTLVVERAIEAATAEGAAFALLWADDSAWYQERGWIPFGSENVFVVDDSNAFLLPDADGVRPMKDGDAAAIHRLYTEHLARVSRTESETRALLGVPGMTTLVRETDGEVTGYACLGRGEDLTGVIHEWGGSPEGVLPIVSQMWADAQGEADGLFFTAPDLEIDFLAYFRFIRATGAKGILSLAKLCSAEAAAKLVESMSPNGVSSRATDEDAIEITGPKGSVVLAGGEILLALCPPRGDRRVTEVVEKEIGAALTDLPIQPYVWGLDSI
ncbi:MAG: GNAT family N-acetyltransferase [Planctomycetota bacterium]